MEQVFVFQHYQASQSAPVVELTERELPIFLMHRREALVRQAGLDYTPNMLVGLLRHPWGNHAPDSIIIARDTNFSPNSPFAISAQPIQRPI